MPELSFHVVLVAILIVRQIPFLQPLRSLSSLWAVMDSPLVFFNKRSVSILRKSLLGCTGEL